MDTGTGTRGAAWTASVDLEGGKAKHVVENRSETHKVYRVVDRFKCIIFVFNFRPTTLVRVEARRIFNLAGSRV
jgi:hypothetical protein